MSFAQRLTDGQLDCCITEFKERVAVVMTREQVRDMLRGHAQRRFCRMLLRGYPDATPGAAHGLDTYERDYLFDIFAERIAGVSHWPFNGDTAEYSQTFIDGIRAANKAGKIKIVEDAA